MLSSMSIVSIVVSFSVLNGNYQIEIYLLNKLLGFMAAFCEVEDREALD